MSPIRAFSPIGATNALPGVGSSQPGANARIGTGFDAGDGDDAVTAPLQSPTLDAPPAVLFAPVQQVEEAELRRIETSYGDPVNGGSADSPIVAALTNTAFARIGAERSVSPRADTTPGMVARAYSAFASA